MLQAASAQQKALHPPSSLTARKYSIAVSQCYPATAQKIEAISGKHEILGGFGLFVRLELPLAPLATPSPKRERLYVVVSQSARSRYSTNTSAFLARGI